MAQVATVKMFTRNEELSLLDGLLAGEPVAGRDFFERYNHLIEMSVRKVFRRAGLAEKADEMRDMVADIWLFLLENEMRSLRRFDPDRNIKLSTWIGLIARNKTIDHLRTSHDRYLFIDVDPEVADRAVTAPSPSDIIEHRQRTELATSAFEQLRADDKRFLEAWYVDDRIPEELADEFGIAVGTVYSRRFKIQEKMARFVSRMTRNRLRRTLH